MSATPNELKLIYFSLNMKKDNFLLFLFYVFYDTLENIKIRYIYHTYLVTSVVL